MSVPNTVKSPRSTHQWLKPLFDWLDNKAKPRNVTVTGAVTINDAIIFVDSTAGAVALTLPSPAAVGAGFRLEVWDIADNANAITLVKHASEKINFSTSAYTVTQGSSVIVETNGTDWYVK